MMPVNFHRSGYVNVKGCGRWERESLACSRRQERQRAEMHDGKEKAEAANPAGGHQIIVVLLRNRANQVLQYNQKIPAQQEPMWRGPCMSGKAIGRTRRWASIRN